MPLRPSDRAIFSLPFEFRPFQELTKCNDVRRARSDVGFVTVSDNDHGHELLSDSELDSHPGYPLVGRLRGLAEIRGVIDGLNVLAATLILMREIAISGLREHLGGRGVVVPASDLAKWKTTFQMVALAALMAAPLAPLETVARVAALTILWVAMGMTLVSGFQYMWATRGEWSKE
mgnify:CR=1 FL=1